MKREDKILNFIKDDAYVPMTIGEMSLVLGVPDEDIKKLQAILDKLENEGVILKSKKKRYMLSKDMGYISGTFRSHEKGFGFVTPLDEGEEDIFIPSSFTMGAMNKDKVLVKVTVKKSGNKKCEGEVVKIISRENTTIVGRFERSRNFGFVVASDKKITQDIFVPKAKFGGAKTGDMVTVKITKWPGVRKSAEGEITEIIGNIHKKGVDIMCVLKSYGINEEFPEDVISSLKNIPEQVRKSDITGRIDLRDKTIFTIDGADSKDLDDAVSIEKNGDIFTLGVHIADVSHYVREKSPLDKEAFNRGTSIYPVDRVVPMLPKKLSNGICSLNPHVDRLALSVIMDISPAGEVISHTICESIINSKEKMTYEAVSKIIEGDGELSKKYAHIKEDIFMMKELASILHDRRTSRGSINFDFPESKITLDENGVPTDVRKYSATVSNGIIEEFMLICNETVAEHFYWMNVPFVYRIHEKPSTEKIDAFNEFLKNTEYSIKSSENIMPMEFAKLLKKIQGKKEEMIISRVMLRSLMKAKYSEENAGHFALAFKHYCHFTSPIRRYPDLLIHRIIKETLNSPLSAKREKFLSKYVAKAALHSSEMEINAQEAEREAEDLKKAQYMKDKIGEKFSGVISSVTSFGFFVELENTIEGLVRLTDLDDDYYIFSESDLCLTGERTKKRYCIGDHVEVELTRVSVPLKEIDFTLCDA